MKSSYSAQAIIHATPEAVWELLTDASAYADWNRTVSRIDGQIAKGERIKVFASLSPDRAFPVTVTELVPNRSMTWQGGMPLGLFQGIRRFRLTEQANSTVEFHMQESFRGLLSPLILRAMPDLTASFEEFATCLKARAEV